MHMMTPPSSKTTATSTTVTVVNRVLLTRAPPKRFPLGTSVLVVSLEPLGGCVVSVVESISNE